MPASFPQGDFTVFLKANQKLGLLSTSIQIITNDTDDPTSVAKDAPIGSWYIRSGTNEWYRKTDAGSTTNWVLVDKDKVVGPVSSTNIAIAKWNGTTGLLLQDSGVLIDVSNNLSGIGNITLSGTVDGRDIAADGSTLDAHLNGGASKHDATEIDYERVDGSKKNIQATSDELEAATTDLDDAIGALAASPTNYTPSSPTIVSSHLIGIDSALGTLTSTINNFEWQESVIDKDTTAQPGSPTTGDRYLLGLDTLASVVTGAEWANHDGEIAEFNGSTWDFTIPTTGMFVAADDENDRLYLFGGTTWTSKVFESTTASGFLSRTGFDITLANLNDGNIIIGSAGNVATSVNTGSLGDIDADTIAGLTIKAGVIINADINASAAIDATKIADGTVTSAEFQFINTLSSNAQTQIDGKLSTAHADGGVSKHDATEIDYERVDGSKKNIQASSDDLETSTTDLDDAIGALDATPTNYTAADVTIVADHLAGIDTSIGTKGTATTNSPLAGNTTATNNTRFLVDTTAVRTITLPAAADNFLFEVKDVTGSANTNNITIARAAAEKIETVAANFIIDSDLSSTTFVSDGTDWFIVS